MCRVLKVILFPFSLLLVPFGGAFAQETGLLYDPDPPPDSAYVRVIVVAPGEPLDLLVNKKPKQQALNFGEAGQYMVLPAGEHRLSFKGKQGEVLAFDLPVPKASSLTVAVVSRSTGAKPLIFEDRANTNKLKALITAYHLAPSASHFDVVAGGNGQLLFSSIAPGVSVHKQVNPVSIDFSLKGDSVVAGATPLTMDFGANYSLFILPAGANGKGVVLKASLNRVERYTGKR